jgi:MCM2/3/5 family protein
MASSANSAELVALKERIVRSLNIREFYQRRITDALKIKSDGWSQLVHCPIHNDTGKPNLSINIHTGGFKCFATCGGGSIFDFWARTNGFVKDTGFREALVALATEAGVDIGNFKSENVHVGLPVDSTATPTPRAYVPQVNKAKAHDESTAPIEKKSVEDWIKQLKPEHYKYLAVKRGLTAATIEKHKIGWDSKRRYKTNEGLWAKGKYMIPIPDKDDLCRNVRNYAEDASKDMKMLNLKGHGSPPRLFPLSLFKQAGWTTVIICEGEFDCMLLNQKLEEQGLTMWGALTNTAGCNTFEPEWVDDLEGCHVILMLDMDKPGKEWAHTHASKKLLGPLSSGKILSLKVVSLPVSGNKDDKDVGDFFLKLGGTLDQLLQCIESTPYIEPGGTESNDATVEAIDLQDFVACMKDRRYIDQRVRVPLTISGQSSKLYHATREFRVVSCPLMKSHECCSNGESQLISFGDELLIESCVINKRQLNISLQQMACTKQQKCVIEEVEKVVMQEFYAHQVVKRFTGTENEDGRIVNAQELEMIPVYVLQPEKNIKIDMQDYIATGYVRSHPQTRTVSFLVEHLEPLQEDWQEFKVTDKTVKDLKLIQGYRDCKSQIDGKEYTGVTLLLKELIHGVTRIYKSDDILLTVLLTFLSPLRFAFNGEFIRGWINSCIIGDTGTGKSATYMRLSDWLEMGDLFSALSGSRTGLLYAIKQRGVEWYVKIGRYVMASGKIIAIDEAQEIAIEDIQKMMLALDTGWLDVNQVASGGYATQTRTMFLMNPKDGKKISDFAFGCKALAECFRNTFIRRLDVAIFSSGKDDYDFYNKEFTPDQKKYQMRLTSQAFRTLIHWAWTRGIDDVHWDINATKECLRNATELANIFGHADDIPLVCPQDFRKNLARLATAYAILCGSFTEDYEGVTVKDKHVNDMAKFISVVYSSSECNLRQHSKISGRQKIMRDYDEIAEKFALVIKNYDNSRDERWREGQQFLQLLLLIQHQQAVRRRDLVEQLAVGPTWVQNHLAILLGHNLIKAYKNNSYVATRRFNLFMRQWQDNPEIEKRLEQVYEKVGKMAIKADIHSMGGNSGYGGNNYGNPDPFYGEADPFVTDEN